MIFKAIALFNGETKTTGEIPLKRYSVTAWEITEDADITIISNSPAAIPDKLYTSSVTARMVLNLGVGPAGLTTIEKLVLAEYVPNVW